MSRRSWTVPVSATLVVLYLALPAVRASLEADMSWHMLVQLPVLAVCPGVGINNALFCKKCRSMMVL